MHEMEDLSKRQEEAKRCIEIAEKVWGNSNLIDHPQPRNINPANIVWWLLPNLKIGDSYYSAKIVKKIIPCFDENRISYVEKIGLSFSDPGGGSGIIDLNSGCSLEPLGDFPAEAPTGNYYAILGEIIKPINSRGPFKTQLEATQCARANNQSPFSERGIWTTAIVAELYLELYLKNPLIAK